MDGDFKGVSPITIPRLSPGTHKVLLTLKEYANTTTNISITGGQTQKYTAELQKVYTPSIIDLILAAGAIVMIAVIAMIVMFRRIQKRNNLFQLCESIRVTRNHENLIVQEEPQPRSLIEARRLGIV